MPHPMRAALVVGLLAAGCGPIPMPHVPAVATDAGRSCVQRCQLLYNQCMGSTSEPITIGASAFEAGGAAGRRRNAINGCRENLGGCYGVCPS